MAAAPRHRSITQVCDFTDAEKEQAQKEMTRTSKRLEMQADMGKFLCCWASGCCWLRVSYDVVPPIIDRAAQLLGFAGSRASAT